MNVLFLGGSTTDCGHCFTPDNLGTGYVKKLSLLPGITATNGGTDGFTFPDVLRKWRLMYAQNTYDCVVVTCGINDVGVIADLAEAGRQEDASVFLNDSMTALQTLLEELTGMDSTGMPNTPADVQTPSAGRQKQSETAPSFGSLSHVSRILLLEPFLFPIPQARILWLPILQKIRERIQATVTAFHATHPSIPDPASDSGTKDTAECNAHPAAKLACNTNVPCVRYVPTQAALDELAARLGYPAVTTDGIHLTDKGHECLAKLVACALGIAELPL